MIQRGAERALQTPSDRTPAPASPQLDLGLRVSARPLRLSRDLRDIPIDRYRLPKDGRKWKAIARERMGLAEWLATYGDHDGTRIWPSVGSMVLHFGWSHGKTCYLLKDLENLGLLITEKHLTGKHGTRKRRMDLRAFLGESWTPRADQEIQHSPKESNVSLDTTVTQTVTKAKTRAQAPRANQSDPDWQEKRVWRQQQKQRRILGEIERLRELYVGLQDPAALARRDQRLSELYAQLEGCSIILDESEARAG